MQNKKRALDSVHWGLNRAKNYYENAPKEFDYGPLDLLGKFKGTHPKVMEEMISRFNWQDNLQYTGKPNKYREYHKHETLKYRFISWIENTFYGGKTIGGFKNYTILIR